MISRRAALDHVLGLVAPLPPVEVAVVESCGAVVAADVVAAAPVPPFANTAMDGIAVRAADTRPGARLRLVGTVAAGDAGDVAVGPDEAVRIMTGAPVPADTDAVVKVEWCTFGRDDAGEWVEVAEGVEPGNHVRPIGDDIEPGDVVLRAGTVLTPGGVALLRTVGRDRVAVHRTPVVGVLSTGDELVEPPATLGPGQIYDSNRAALVGLVAEAGARAVDLGLVADDEAAIEAALRHAAATCDAVVSSGGVSMGDFDYVKAVLDRIGDMRWMQVAIKPAKPLAVGTLDVDGRRVPVLGLPGNPVSSIVSFELFARPALRRLAGHPDPERPVLTVVAGEDLRRRADGKEHLVRVTVSADGAGSWVARSAGRQGSHHVAALALANALAVLPDGEGVAAGDPVDALVTGPVG